MNYYLIDMEDGSPRIPEHVAFGLLANPRGQPWGLYECHLSKRVETSRAVVDVPLEDQYLIESAKGYPPALALARYDVDDHPEMGSKSDFLRVYPQLLRTHLRAQRVSRYILAEVRVDLGVHLPVGSFVWLIRYKPERDEVLYVGDSLHTYPAPAGVFDVDRRELVDRLCTTRD